MAAAGPVRIVFKGRPAFGGHWVDCPDTPHFPAKVITLYITPAGVVGTCGKTHTGRDDNGRKTKPAECVFQVQHVTKEELQALAAPGKTGRVRGKLPTGTSVDAQIISLGAGTGAQGAAAPGKGGAAAQAFGAAKNGKGAAAAGAQAPARVPRGGGGAASAFFNAVAATAGAVGQVAGAAGQIAGSAASAVGSVADLGKEGIGAARDGIKEAGKYGQRRHERKMRDGGDSDD
ncbi:hypothetical protein GCM10010363_60080 [Streptomyces omiyaensis]|uniref:hypothetical protein n=1 Tax=Streptomyces omiyaensis TaxID=68247 RepID=UPI001677AEF4|nr:hypothetical protein [Streptomyces omiyaensis]GGY70952.1 hypothetical protein GCM10010363_60080 [Streptomyces omiyaensis]